MNYPSVKTLRSICDDAEQAKLVRFAFTADIDAIRERFPATDQWIRSCYHMPKDIDVRMFAADEALRTHGVESVKGRNGKLLEYCNAGDSYAATLCFQFDPWVMGGRRLKRVFVGSCGDWVERYGEREDY